MPEEETWKVSKLQPHNNKSPELRNCLHIQVSRQALMYTGEDSRLKK
jgi:hypothetical protein